jgi:hypothetical protein
MALHPLLVQAMQSFTLFLLLVSLHYCAAHAYSSLCTPLGWRGFFESVYMVNTPQCFMLRWTIYNGGNSITYGLIAMGLWGLQILRSFIPDWIVVID